MLLLGLKSNPSPRCLEDRVLTSISADPRGRSWPRPDLPPMRERIAHHRRKAKQVKIQRVGSRALLETKLLLMLLSLRQPRPTGGIKAVAEATGAVNPVGSRALLVGVMWEVMAVIRSRLRLLLIPFLLPNRRFNRVFGNTACRVMFVDALKCFVNFIRYLLSLIHI